MFEVRAGVRVAHSVWAQYSWVQFSHIHLVLFLEDKIANKQILNCIMFKLFPNVSITMKICIFKTRVITELTVPCDCI